MEVDGVHQKKRKSGANVEAAAAEAEEAGAKPKQERKAPDFSQRILFRCPIACPLMEKSKSYKKLFKLVKKGKSRCIAGLIASLYNCDVHFVSRVL